MFASDPIDNPYDWDIPDPSPGLEPPVPIDWHEQVRVYNEAFS